jgi:hypothetical protein
MSDQNRGQMSSGVLKASDGQRNFIKREKRQLGSTAKIRCPTVRWVEMGSA